MVVLLSYCVRVENHDSIFGDVGMWICLGCGPGICPQALCFALCAGARVLFPRIKHDVTYGYWRSSYSSNLSSTRNRVFGSDLCCRSALISVPEFFGAGLRSSTSCFAKPADIDLFVSKLPHLFQPACRWFIRRVDQTL